MIRCPCSCADPTCETCVQVLAAIAMELFLFPEKLFLDERIKHHIADVERHRPLPGEIVPDNGQRPHVARDEPRGLDAYRAMMFNHARPHFLYLSDDD